MNASSTAPTKDNPEDHDTMLTAEEKPPKYPLLYREKDGMRKVPDLMQRLNHLYGVDDNTVFFNYCKWSVGSNDSALSEQIQQAEALVRFLSGTTHVLVIGLVAFLPFSIVFLILGPNGKSYFSMATLR